MIGWSEVRSPWSVFSWSKSNFQFTRKKEFTPNFVPAVRREDAETIPSIEVGKFLWSEDFPEENPSWFLMTGRWAPSGHSVPSAQSCGKSRGKRSIIVLGLENLPAKKIFLPCSGNSLERNRVAD